MDFTEKARRLYRPWSLRILKEWSRIEARTDGFAAPFNLALLYLVDLHGALQDWLQDPTADQHAARAATSLSRLGDSPLLAAIPDILTIHRSILSQAHQKPVRVGSEHHLSYSEAVEAHRLEMIRLFAPSAEVGSGEDPLIRNEDLIANWVDARDSEQRLPTNAERPDGIVVGNNVELSLCHLQAYEAWIQRNWRWDFRLNLKENVPAVSGDPLTLKELERALDLCDESLRDYREKAGLPVGARGKRCSPLSAGDTVKLCQTIERQCPTAETRAKAAKLKAKYLPNSQKLKGPPR